MYYCMICRVIKIETQDPWFTGRSWLYAEKSCGLSSLWSIFVFKIWARRACPSAGVRDTSCTAIPCQSGLSGRPVWQKITKPLCKRFGRQAVLSFWGSKATEESFWLYIAKILHCAQNDKVKIALILTVTGLLWQTKPPCRIICKAVFHTFN